jgi:hypothetical protein
MNTTTGMFHWRGLLFSSFRSEQLQTAGNLTNQQQAMMPTLGALWECCRACCLVFICKERCSIQKGNCRAGVMVWAHWRLKVLLALVSNFPSTGLEARGSWTLQANGALVAARRSRLSSKGILTSVSVLLKIKIKINKNGKLQTPPQPPCPVLARASEE